MVQIDPFKPLDMPEAHPVITSTQGNTILQPAYPGSYPSVPIGGGNAVPNANYSAHRTAEPNSPDQANQFPFNPGGGVNPFNPGGGVNPFQPGNPANPFQTNAPGGANARANALPDGVARIFALQSNNSLLIEATPDGYNQVKQIVKI